MTDKLNPLEQKLTEIRLQHTFEMPHALLLLDTLTARILSYTLIPDADARKITEGLIRDRLTELGELNRCALAADAADHEDADAYRCDDNECTENARTVHEHGPECSHLCRCGKGRM